MYVSSQINVNCHSLLLCNILFNCVIATFLQGTGLINNAATIWAIAVKENAIYQTRLLIFSIFVCCENYVEMLPKVKCCSFLI